MHPNSIINLYRCKSASAVYWAFVVPRMDESRARSAKAHRRSSKVCARCKKRKTKCDFRFPACTPCKLAKVPCRGYDPATREETPRSLVRSLEDQIAELESQDSQFRNDPQNTSYLVASKIARATLSTGIPSAKGLFSSTLSAALFLRPSCPPFAVVRHRSTSEIPVLQTPSEDEIVHPIPRPTILSINLNTIPRPAMERIIQNYTEIHLPQYPIITASWLDETLEKVLREQDGDSDSVLTYGITADSGLTHFDYFVVFIVFAISSSTLTFRARLQAQAASNSFGSSALRHLQLMADVDEIKKLQVSLLLTHYAHMNPEKADNWTSISNATRLILDLGLHKMSAAMIGDAQMKQGRRLFWVTYGMERSLCSLLRLPLSFPEDSITTEFEIPSEADPGSHESTSDDTRKKSSANHIYLFRKLETEAHRVLHLLEDVGDVPKYDITNWLRDIDQRLDDWYEAAQGFGAYRMLEFREVQYNHLKLKLHRPTPRLRSRTTHDRQICFDACQVIVEDYMKQDKNGKLFYPWHGVQILFEAATVLLDSCWSSRGSLLLLPQIRRVTSASLPDCIFLIAKIGEKWKEAAACADYLRPVVSEIARAFEYDATDESLFRGGDVLISEKIRDLLFSDGPLSWETEAPFPGVVAGLEESNASFDLTVSAEMQGFQWDLSWELGDSGLFLGDL